MLLPVLLAHAPRMRMREVSAALLRTRFAPSLLHVSAMNDPLSLERCSRPSGRPVVGFAPPPPCKNKNIQLWLWFPTLTPSAVFCSVTGSGSLLVCPFLCASLSVCVGLGRMYAATDACAVACYWLAAARPSLSVAT